MIAEIVKLTLLLLGAGGGALVGGLIFVTLFEHPPADFSRNILTFILPAGLPGTILGASPAASPNRSSEARWFARRRLQEHNEERPHSSLGYRTPQEFASQWAASVRVSATPQPSLQQLTAEYTTPTLFS